METPLIIFFISPLKNQIEWTYFFQIIRSLNESGGKGENKKRFSSSELFTNEITQSKAIKVVKFDGQIDPSWVENLTLLTNENKVHCFSNGDTIYLDNLKIVFETDNLTHCTPSMVI